MNANIIPPSSRNYSPPSDRPTAQTEQQKKGMLLTFLTNAIGQLNTPQVNGYQIHDTNQDEKDQQNTFVAYGILFALVIGGFYLITKIK